mmetsp:Transcript_12740/g.35621  ORF Transcript_12740/g.35621 Transcript_12740/m.35621 type:complete len:87 (-) Transcript_12740:27-287(-)
MRPSSSTVLALDDDDDEDDGDEDEDEDDGTSSSILLNTFSSCCWSRWRETRCGERGSRVMATEATRTTREAFRIPSRVVMAPHLPL